MHASFQQMRSNTEDIAKIMISEFSANFSLTIHYRILYQRNQKPPIVHCCAKTIIKYYNIQVNQDSLLLKVAAKVEVN